MVNHQIRSIVFCLVAASVTQLFAHEQPTHVQLTQRALAYLEQADNQRFKVLSQKYGFFALSSALADGSFNEDADFGNQCSAPCPFLGRFYFHFLPTMNDTLTLGGARIGLGASCSSVEWGISSGSCAAFLVPLGLPTGQPLLDTPESHGATNDHTWSKAIAETDTGGAPTLEGWRHLSYLIHLLEDLTSPPHTRSSAHPCPGGFGPFCDPLDSLNLAVLPGQINVPASDYVGLSNLGTPADLFQRVQSYTHANYFSARTAFNGDGGPTTTINDDNYFYGACLPVSMDVGTCNQIGGLPARKIAHKGQQFYASALYGPPDPRKADLDATIGREQFQELGPVAVLGVAALIKFYAPMLTVNVSGNGHGTITSTAGNLNCTTNTPCAILLAQTTSGPPSAVLTATPTSDSVFTSWSGDCSGTATSVTVNLTGDKNCTATFTRQPFTVPLTITQSSSQRPGTPGSGSSSGCPNSTINISVSFSVTVPSQYSSIAEALSAGYRFDQIGTGSGTAVNYQGTSCQGNVSHVGPESYEVLFSKNELNLRGIPDNIGIGTINPTGVWSISPSAVSYSGGYFQLGGAQVGTISFSIIGMIGPPVN